VLLLTARGQGPQQQDSVHRESFPKLNYSKKYIPISLGTSMKCTRDNNALTQHDAD